MVIVLHCLLWGALCDKEAVKSWIWSLLSGGDKSAVRPCNLTRAWGICQLVKNVVQQWWTSEWIGSDITYLMHLFSVSLEYKINATYPLNFLGVNLGCSLGENHMCSWQWSKLCSTLNIQMLAAAILGTVSDNLVLRALKSSKLITILNIPRLTAGR